MTDSTYDPDEQESGLLGTLFPYLAGTAIVTIALFLGAMRFGAGQYIAPLVATGTPSVVTFDAVKYTNAQRAVASAFLKPGVDPQDVNDILMNLSERTRDAIRSQAGPGTIVIIKQAVVQGQLRDITDAVLKDLNLPVKEIPTSNGVEYTLDLAPTMLMQVPTLREFARPVKRPVTNAEESLP